MMAPLVDHAAVADAGGARLLVVPEADVGALLDAVVFADDGVVEAADVVDHYCGHGVPPWICVGVTQYMGMARGSTGSPRTERRLQTKDRQRAPFILSLSKDSLTLGCDTNDNLKLLL